jgi:hypothetical protein
MVPQARPSPAAAVGPVVAPSDAAHAEARDTFRAVRATGANVGESLRLAIQAHGAEAVRPLWDQWALTCDHPGAILGSAGNIARAFPETANAWCNAWLAGRGKGAFLALAGRPWLTALPDGLEAVQDLSLAGTGLRSLPKGLRVAGVLTLPDNPDWDGLIPEDAWVGGIRVGRQARQSLEAWREDHPHGARGER